MTIRRRGYLGRRAEARPPAAKESGGSGPLGRWARSWPKTASGHGASAGLIGGGDCSTPHPAWRRTQALAAGVGGPLGDRRFGSSATHCAVGL